MPGLIPYLPASGIRPEESISSLLDRAGALYGVDGVVFGDLFLRHAASLRGINTPSVSDWDNPPRVVQCIIAESMNISDAILSDHVIHDGPRWLAPGSRSAYCPRCFAEDLEWSNGFPYFRRTWAQIATTFCYKHDPPQPLANWPSPTPDKRFYDSGRLMTPELITDQVMWLTAKQLSKRRAERLAMYRERIYTYVQYEPYCLEVSALQRYEEDVALNLHMWDERIQVWLDHAYKRHSESESDSLTRLRGILGPNIERLAMLLNSLSFQAGRLLQVKERWYWNTDSSGSIQALPRSQSDESRIDERAAWEALRVTGDPDERRAIFWLAACSEGRHHVRRLCEPEPIFVPYLLFPTQQ